MHKCTAATITNGKNGFHYQLAGLQRIVWHATVHHFIKTKNTSDTKVGH